MFSAARWRLTAVFTAILVVILVISGLVVYFTTSSLIYSRVNTELADQASSQMFLVDDQGGHDPGHDEPGPSGQQFNRGGYFYAVMDASGKVTDSSYGFDSNTLASATTIQKALTEGSATFDAKTTAGQTQRVYVAVADSHNGEPLRLLEIGRSIKPEQDDLNQLRDILIIVIAVSVIPTVVAGYFISGRVLRPIKASVDAQRAFIADASHELRTPVAVVRTNAELLDRRMSSGKIGQSENDKLAVEDILAETDRLAKMVTQMLTLAQADAGQATIQRTDIDLDEVALDVVRAMRAIADAKGVALGLQNGEEVWVHGDRDRLREVIVTVLDNAVKYTPTGGHVDVRVARHHRKALITISDTGSGIPAESLAHIFERFYRVDEARSRDEGGTGLGLAIARHIVEAHGGEIHIESAVGRGTKVTIELRLLHHEQAPDATQQPREAGA